MSLFLPDLQKFFLQATAEVVYWRCSLIKWIKSSLVPTRPRPPPAGQWPLGELGTDKVSLVSGTFSCLLASPAVQLLQCKPETHIKQDTISYVCTGLLCLRKMNI